MAKRTPPEPEGALYVRLPAAAVDKLDRAAMALGVHKKDLVAGLVTRYVDPDSRKGLSALNALTPPRRGPGPAGTDGLTYGSYSFQPYAPAEVLTAEQAGELLQLDERLVLELAEAGTLPGRKLGPTWRFSRTALLAWLSGPQQR